MIEVRNLSKTFRVHRKSPGFWGSVKSLVKREYINKEALKNINLSINEGEIVGLIGANGAGKTTLTKILAGIIHPSAGEVSILGHNPWRRPDAYRSQMSLIMGQKAQLWWDLPAMDGLLLLKEIYRIPGKQFSENIAYLSDCLDIHDQLNIQVRKLSLGERMKVELIAALIHNPKVVFLDEPTIGLDISAQKAVRKFLAQYRERYRPIMILTSHYMDDIEQLCKRILVIREGELIYDGELSKIQNQYAVHKIITATVSEELSLNELKRRFPSELGDTSIDEVGRIQIVTPRARAMDAASHLLAQFKIADLNITEPDIADIIERIMRGEK